MKIALFPFCCHHVGAAALVLSGVATLTAQTEPRFVGLQFTNQELRLSLSAPKRTNYQVEVTTDLMAWQPLVILTNVTGTLEHLDTATPWLASRFYRAGVLSGANVLTGDFLPTTGGALLIHPIHHATLLLRWQNRVIYVDPVPVNGVSPFKGMPLADLILVTHEHTDPFAAGSITALKSTNTVILTTRTVYQSLSSSLKAITTVLTNGASADVLGINVKAVPAYNLHSSNHPKGIGNGYLLALGDRHVYLSGDTDDTPEMRALQNIDVTFVCMDGVYNMNYTSAASAVRQFIPKTVYPYHYLTNNPSSFKQLVGRDRAIEVRLRPWE